MVSVRGRGEERVIVGLGVKILMERFVIGIFSSKDRTSLKPSPLTGPQWDFLL